MKNNFLKTLIAFSIGTFLFAGTVVPTISLRYNDIVNTNNDLATLTSNLVVGFAMEVEDGVMAGFDSDGSDSRIFVALDYGTLGMGINANGDPQFTIGATYNALSNLGVSLDYVVNNLTTDGDGGGASPNELRMSLGINF
jgi:hypothetical protein